MTDSVATKAVGLSHAAKVGLGRRLPLVSSMPNGPGEGASDRGSQYASHDYRCALEQEGITCSMSRRGNCWDNEVAESFLGTLKVELIHRKTWATRAEAMGAISEYIDDFYNVRQRHSSLGYLSPLAFELRASTEERGGFASTPRFTLSGGDQEVAGLAV